MRVSSSKRNQGLENVFVISVFEEQIRLLYYCREIKFEILRMINHCHFLNWEFKKKTADKF